MSNLTERLHNLIKLAVSDGEYIGRHQGELTPQAVLDLRAGATAERLKTADALIADSLRQLVKQQWRPIETAPLDLQVVLLYQPSKPGFADAVGQGHRTDLRDHAHDRWVFQASGWVCEPTHWMPLPEPPVSLTDEHGEAK